MPDLSSIVDVTITRDFASVSAASFGIPLVAAFHNHYSDLIRTYNSTTVLSTMVADGFSTSEPAYYMVRALVAQNPRPRQIKVGKLSTFTQQYTLIATVANTTAYTGRVNGEPWTFTSDGTATAAEVAVGIAAAIDALTGVTATAQTTPDRVVIVADTAGRILEIDRAGSVGTYSIADTTAAGTVAADLAALRVADTDWYSFGIDRLSEPAIEAAAAWAETQRVIFFPTTVDTDTLLTGSTTDVAADLAASNFARTSLWYSDVATDYLGLAVLSTVLPYQPGAAAFYYRRPALVQPSNISTTQEGALTTKHANWLARVAGLNISENGTLANGDFADNKLAEDWVVARIQEAVFAFLAGSPKIPYEDKSVERLKGVIAGVLQLGIDRGVIAASPTPVIDAPKVANVAPADKANRNLPDVVFSFTLSGGIKTTTINGLISV